MEEEKTLWSAMFEETEKEKEINGRIDKEMEDFENSSEYAAHRERLNALFDELRVATAERQKNGKEFRRNRFPLKSIGKETDEQREKRLAENRKRKEERIASLPEKLKQTIYMYNSLSDDEKKVFGKEAVGYEDFDLDEMENKQITHEQTCQLQDILVQTCIDFINEQKLKDVDAVYFSADSLQTSAKYNKWTPDTDSFLTLEGMEKSDKDGGFYVRRFIDKSY